MPLPLRRSSSRDRPLGHAGVHWGRAAGVCVSASGPPSFPSWQRVSEGRGSGSGSSVGPNTRTPGLDRNLRMRQGGTGRDVLERGGEGAF